MSNKYQLSGVYSTKYPTFQRIQALVAFGTVKIGDLGGFVQSTDNLSQSGTSWLYDDSMCYGHAVVQGNAELHNNAFAHECAVLTDNAKAYDNVEICGHAVMQDNSTARENARLYAYAKAKGDVEVTENISY